MAPDPRQLLFDAGVQILDPVLRPYGFVYSPGKFGYAPEGWYACGRFVRGDRLLDLYQGSSLQLWYRVANLSIDHGDYMTFLGATPRSEYLRMPSDAGLAQYSALRSDLERFCADFLSGSAETIREAVQEAARRKKAVASEDMVSAVGDRRNRTMARELFRQRRYAEAAQMYEALQYPDQLSPAEQAIWRKASDHARGG